jgi:hypothetical protein
MPLAETLERFVVRAEENADAILEFYTANASTQENQAPPQARLVVSRCVRPVFVSGNKVVIRWIFEFEWLDGKQTRMKELACNDGMGS